MQKAIRLFLDLEDTVVDNWDDFMFIPSKCEKIRNYIKDNNIAEVIIFSFAIDDEKDEEIFKRQHREDLERVLGVKVGLVVTSNDVKRITGHKLLHELKYFGKQISFLHYIDIIKDDNTDYVLIDDMVENLTVAYCDSNNIITLINIDSWGNKPKVFGDDWHQKGVLIQ